MGIRDFFGGSGSNEGEQAGPESSEALDKPFMPTVTATDEQVDFLERREELKVAIKEGPDEIAEQLVEHFKSIEGFDPEAMQEGRINDALKGIDEESRVDVVSDMLQDSELIKNQVALQNQLDSVQGLDDVLSEIHGIDELGERSVDEMNLGPGRLHDARVYDLLKDALDPEVIAEAGERAGQADQDPDPRDVLEDITKDHNSIRKAIEREHGVPIKDLDPEQAAAYVEQITNPQIELLGASGGQDISLAETGRLGNAESAEEQLENVRGEEIER